MPTDDFSELILHKDDLCKAFFELARDFSTWVNEVADPSQSEATISLATIGGAAKLVEALLEKEKKDDA